MRSRTASTILKESNRPMPKITPFLWFDNQAEEAANFYASIFPNSKIKVVTLPDVAPQRDSSTSTTQERSADIRIAWGALQLRWAFACYLTPYPKSELTHSTSARRPRMTGLNPGC
jgi:predicted 3-demethylubiquinone-9 3-methyltransferase (glyoxalase superfamily)